jgi:prepilin-type N-terminal cleavage/methylation domain-containing protein
MPTPKFHHPRRRSCHRDLGRRYSRSGRSEGFTLIEVLIVVVIIAILMAILALSGSGILTRHRLNIAQDEVYRGIQLAQRQAQQQRQDWQFSIRDLNPPVQWAVHPMSTPPAGAVWQELDPRVRLDPESTLALAGGVRQVQFNYRGAVQRIPLGRITLSSRDGGRLKRCVFVSTILGALRKSTEKPTPREGKYCY